jgi:hypothetical protein
MRRQENIKNAQHSKVGRVNLGARNTPKASRKCQENGGMSGFMLLADPGFIEKKRICPNEQKEHQKLVLKSVQIQKRRADEDACQWRVSYDLPDKSNRFFLHI